ncbi:MAG: glycosyltransferase family 2 protein [Bacillaceae bacterium]|nr:glycosyltransferase family 2 protein [Bacillaceae bacterium]
MPPVEKNSSFGSIIESFASLGPLLATLFKLIFLTSFVVVLIRAVLFIYLSYKQKQTHTSIITEDYKPFVSVILPVYNEEKVIENTVSTILASNYTNYEIVIIDDGSTDRTRSILESNFNHLDHVHFISKENEGKAASLNRGIQEAQGDIIITMDADTEINEEAISYLIRHFQDPMVSAVSGNVKVGNKRKILSLWQHIEYVTSFNLEKRALQMINSITVVPGALGAWRKEDIEKVNLFEEETLAEDTDLTIKIIRTGKRIIFEEKAIGYTEVPTKLKDLTKQRLRWYFGILQSLWKHKDALFQRKYKGLAFVGIPNMMFQITFQLLVPIIDILLIIALLTQTYSLLIYILIFIAIDTFISLYAFKLERERLSPLRWIIIQRFAYRIFFAYITWKVVIKAIQGVSVKWGKLDRIGKKSY